MMKLDEARDLIHDLLESEDCESFLEDATYEEQRRAQKEKRKNAAPKDPELIKANDEALRQ